MTNPPQSGSDRDLLGDADLDALFVQARDTEATPTKAFLSAAEATALALMPPRAAVENSGPGLVAQLGDLLRALGGWRGGIALAGSAMAGLAIGYLDPMALDLLYFQTDVAAQDLTDPLADFLTEGGI